MKKTKLKRSLNAVTLRISIYAFVIWLVFVFCITFAATEYIYSTILGQQTFWAGQRLWHVYETNSAMRHENPEVFRENMDREILETISSANTGWGWSRNWRWNENISRERFSVLRRDFADFQTAVIIYDGDGNMLRQSGCILQLRYVTEDEWNEGVTIDTSGARAYVVIDNIAGDGNMSALIADLFGARWEINVVSARLTGYFEGAEFRLSKLEYISRTRFWEVTEGGFFIDHIRHVRFLVSTGQLEWQTLFDNTEGNEDLTTIYSLATWHFPYDPGGRIRHQGVVYDNVLDLLQQFGARHFRRTAPDRLGVIPWEYQEFSLREIISINGFRLEEFQYFDYDTPPQRPDFVVLSVTVARPLNHCNQRIAECLYRNIYNRRFGSAYTAAADKG